MFQSVVRGETPDYRIEKRYIRKDGAIAWANVNVALLRDSKGRPLRTVAAIEDITQHKRAEDERNRLIMAIEHAAEAIVVTDPEGVIEYVNPAFEQITGYTRAEALGKNPSILNSGAQDRAFYANLWIRSIAARVGQGRS